MDYRIVKNNRFKDENIYECQDNKTGYFKTMYLYHWSDGSFNAHWNNTWIRENERPLAIYKTIEEAEDFIKSRMEKLYFLDKEKYPNFNQHYVIPLVEEYVYNRYHDRQYIELTSGFFKRNKLGIGLAIIIFIPMLLEIIFYVLNK